MLYLYVLPTDTLSKPHGLIRRVQEIRPVLEGVDGLDHDSDVRRFGLPGGEAHALARQRQLFVAAHAGDFMPYQRVHPLAS